MPKLLENWDAKKSIGAPLIVNLLSAFFLFFSVVFFQDRIYALLGITTELREFPLECVVEPYEGQDGNVLADIFLFNTTAKDYTEAELLDLIRIRGASHAESIAQPRIEIRTKSDSWRIVDIIDNPDHFNDGKGEFDIGQEQGSRTWTIRIRRIQGKAVILWTVVTEGPGRPGISRDSKASAPVEVTLAGMPM